MEDQITERLRYPIGPFIRLEQYSPDQLLEMISIIEGAPAHYTALTKNLTGHQLAKTYRPGSWNVQQLIHHVADIQMVHFFRMKKALTEPDYREVTLINMDAWTKTPDGEHAPVRDSLDMLNSITRRYVFLLRGLSETQLQISYYHPIRKYTINQAQAMAMSAWHLEHHRQHIIIAIGNN